MALNRCFRKLKIGQNPGTPFGYRYLSEMSKNGALKATFCLEKMMSCCFNTFVSFSNVLNSSERTWDQLILTLDGLERLFLKAEKSVTIRVSREGYPGTPQNGAFSATFCSEIMLLQCLYTTRGVCNVFINSSKTSWDQLILI